ncbi:MAG: hypothetical protein JJU34_00770 [Lunatimonas sp.]|uniref:hypothetical protein n=1 Tax=Lunatimonas sp. TaxID=2060141 RepID=UPI00263A7FDA|nr:hypothetical protein [Lunatimonas sp.]MCC5935787.1 hypothetical protein [Lunatimonas sp.]
MLKNPWFYFTTSGLSFASLLICLMLLVRDPQWPMVLTAISLAISTGLFYRRFRQLQNEADKA